MDSFIEQQLNLIEQAARQIILGIRGIIGYSNGQEMVAQKLFPTQPSIAQGNEFGNQPTISLTEEIKQMIVELKIKGSVRERANGLIELRTQALGSIYGRTKDEIEQKLNERLKEAKNKKKTAKEKNKTPLLSEFFNSEYLPYKRNEIKPSTLAEIELDMRFVLGSGMDKRINGYTTKELEAFILSIPSTRKRQKTRGTLNNIFSYAKRMGVIKSNPCEDVVHIKHMQKQGRALTFEAQEELFQKLRKNENLTTKDKLFLCFVYLTGTRRAEASCITKYDFDIPNNIVHIRGTKTEKSDRIMPLSSLVKRIYELLADTTTETLFDMSNDKASRLLDQLGMDYHLHELRHTFGTIQVCVNKLDPKTVSLYMGHSTITMTLERYTHPEQLDKSTFYNGALSQTEKLELMQDKYNGVLATLSQFLDECTQKIPK